VIGVFLNACIRHARYANRAKNIKTKAIIIRVDQPPPPPKVKFLPTVKYDPSAAPVKVRGVDDFLVRHEKARLMHELTGIKAMPLPQRGHSSPVGLYKRFLYFQAFVHESIILLPPPTVLPK